MVFRRLDGQPLPRSRLRRSLGRGVLGDGLGALGDGVFGQLTGQDQSNGGLDLAR